jgi:hypothetical protein
VRNTAKTPTDFGRALPSVRLSLPRFKENWKKHVARSRNEATRDPDGDAWSDFVNDITVLTRTVVVALGVAFVAIALLAVFSLKLYFDLRHVVQARTAEAQVANQRQINDCFAQASEVPALERALLSVKPTDAVRDYLSLREVNAPTFADCRQLARQLGGR